MTEARYRAELELALQEACDDSRCGIEYPSAEMGTCSWCKGTFCRCHFHAELNCCHAVHCVYSAANRLRELRDAALVVLETAGPFEWAWQVATALEILRGEKR